MSVVISAIPLARTAVTYAALSLLLIACGGDATSPAPPSGTTGTITGRATSASGGAGIAGASVSTTPATGGATTDAQGNFSITSVAPGSYTVTASASGYTTGSSTVSVSAGQTAVANLSLAVAVATYNFTQVGTIAGPTAGIASVALSPDGTILAYGAYGQSTIKIVNVATRTEIRTLSGHTAPVSLLQFSPDGQRLVSTGTVNLPPATDGSVRLWTVSTGAQIASVSTAGTNSLRFSRDGTLIAGAGGGTPVQTLIWSGTTLAPVRTIANVFVSVAFSPDGSLLAGVARDDLVHVMNVSTGAEVMALAGHTGWANATAYNAAGTLIASGGEDRAIRLWDASTGAAVRTLTGHTSKPELVQFNADGTVLASLGSGVNVTRNGSSVSMTFSSADKVLRIWTVATGALLATVNVGSDALTDITFSADWRTLVTSSDAGSIRIFTR